MDGVVLFANSMTSVFFTGEIYEAIGVDGNAIADEDTTGPMPYFFNRYTRAAFA
jgi:hypothetical protein